MAIRDRAAQWALTGAVCAALAVLVSADAPQTPASNAERSSNAPQLAAFKTRLDAYASLRKKLEDSLPKLPKEATPEQIDRHQRSLAALISGSRAKAKQADLFTPEGQTYVRGLLKRLFANIDRTKLRHTIQDENPGPVQLTINGRYPDDVPLATMPPEVLHALPPLPEEVEYRFVGDSLILLDTRGYLVLDIVPNALPK